MNAIKIPENMIHVQGDDGLLVVEAEDFYDQEKDEIRRWYVHSANLTPPDEILGGTDKVPLETASGGAYIQILPDTRRTHDDPLVRGESFSNVPGVLGVIHYAVEFKEEGRYYVWVRAFSTGSEDNGVHVGLDRTNWPASGQRLQWCAGKHTWHWESKQRTLAQHCGVPYEIYLDIPNPGIHTVSFSMREDGFRMDQFLLTKDRDFQPSPTALPPSRKK